MKAAAFFCDPEVEDDNGEILGYVVADIRERAIYYEYLEAVNDEKNHQNSSGRQK